MRFSHTRLLSALCWGALITNLLAWYVIRQADDWSLATLLSYGPRWIWLLPPLALAPAAYFPSFRWSRGVPLAWAAFIAAVPILQYEFGRFTSPDEQGNVIKVVSMNAASKGDPAALRLVLDRERPDIVIAQEWARPKEPMVMPGYSLLCQEALCVLSPYPMERAGVLDRRDIGGWNLMAALTKVTTPYGDIMIGNVHLDTPREGIEAVQRRESDAVEELQSNIVSRGLESRLVSKWLAEVPGPLLIAGDFNLPADSAIYRKHWTRWADAFDVAGWGYGWTKYTSWWGVRIDHILFDPAHWEAIEAWVGDDVGSDHRPVIARVRRR